MNVVLTCCRGCSQPRRLERYTKTRLNASLRNTGEPKRDVDDIITLKRLSNYTAMFTAVEMTTIPDEK